MNLVMVRVTTRQLKSYKLIGKYKRSGTPYSGIGMMRQETSSLLFFMSSWYTYEGPIFSDKEGKAS